MKLTNIATLLFSSIIAFTPLHSLAASQSTATPKKVATSKTSQKAGKKAAKNATTKSTTAKKATTKKRVPPQKSAVATPKSNTKALYGVNGAKLQPTKVSNKQYTYREKGKSHTTISKEASRLYSQTGVASYYGGMFHGRKTANGEIYNQYAYTAAHKTLALGSYALVTNLRNGKKVIVRINDRGPFSKNRIIDLSVSSAREIGMLHSGVAQVRVEAMQVDSQGYITGKGAESLMRLAKKEGLSLKVKGSGNNLAIKAEHSLTKAEKKRAGKNSEHLAKNATEQTASPSLVVTTKTEKQAKHIAKIVKQKAHIEKVGDQYKISIAVADQKESDKVKKQVAKLALYQTMHYSTK